MPISVLSAWNCRMQTLGMIIQWRPAAHIFDGNHMLVTDCAYTAEYNFVNNRQI